MDDQDHIDEMVRARNTDLPRPEWMQSHRWTMIKIEARKLIAALPPVAKEPRTGDKVHYETADRTQLAAIPPNLATGQAGVGDGVIHEAVEDGLPYCAADWTSMYRGFTPKQWREGARRLGQGGVTCGHCARKRKA
jgi:hypothetical protein